MKVRQPTLRLPTNETLLQLGCWIVPAGERGEWLRFWQAELWHSDHAAMRRNRVKARLHAGLICDALWLRRAAIERALDGTAWLCLFALAMSCGAAALPGVLRFGGMRPFADHFSLEYMRFVLASPLIIVATLLTVPRRPTRAEAGQILSRARGAAFFGSKVSLQFALAYLLSTDISAPLHPFSFNGAAFVQMFLFVLFSVLGLRWTFEDQQVRCKRCLRLLNEPARVGRPSRNLLEWNGTELLCRRGHGSLTVPELETSWHQSSEWSHR